MKIPTRSVLLAAGFALAIVTSARPSTPAAGTTPGTTSGTAPAATPAATSFDPRVETVMRRVADYGRSLRSFRVEVRHRLTIRAGGQNVDQTSVWTAAVVRPNHLALRQTEGTAGRTVISDGKHLWFYLAAPMHRIVAERDAPETVADIIELPDWKVGGAEESMIPELLAARDGYTLLMEGVTGTRYVGTEAIDGVDCDRLRFSGGDRAWDLWVERGDRPLPRRLVPDLAAAIAAMAAQNPQFQDMTGTSTTDFTRWSVNEDLPADVFAYTPPASATQVPSLIAAMNPAGPGGGDGGASPGGMPPGDSDAMVGHSAPTFELARLDGGKASLARHKGKDVVVLDFWATWCGPCRMSMPILAGVAKDYAGKHVAVYAVNLREDSLRVRKFLDQQGLALNVLLDRNGSVGLDYRADRIPRTVIVGKDGLVKAVHSGYRPDLKAVFTSELDALLAGRSLPGGADPK